MSAKKEIKKDKLITISMPGLDPKTAKNVRVLFQLNGESRWLPVNKPCAVEDWVYDLWLNSSYNAGLEDPVDEEHIVTDKSN